MWIGFRWKFAGIRAAVWLYFRQFEGFTILSIQIGQNVGGFLIADDLFGRGIEIDHPLRAIGRIGQMAQRRREVSFFDIRIEFFDFAALDAVDEILVMAAAFVARRARIAVFTLKDLITGVTRADHPTLGTKEEIADDVTASPSTQFGIGYPMANFEDYHFVFVGVFVRGDHAIGSFLIVFEHEVATDATGLCRQSDAESPAGHIELMHALIADVAVTVIPVPVPFVMKAVAGVFA